MAAGAPVDESPAKGPAAVDDSAEVDIEHPVVFVGGRIEEHPGVADAGIVDDDVGNTVRGTDLIGEPFDRVGVGDVERVRVSDAAACRDRRGGLLDSGLVHVADHHLGTLPGKGQRRRAADTAARSGDGNQCVAEVLTVAADLRAQ